MTNRPIIHVSGNQGCGVSSVARTIAQLGLADIIVEVPHNRRVTVVDREPSQPVATAQPFTVVHLLLCGGVIGFIIGMVVML